MKKLMLLGLMFIGILSLVACSGGNEDAGTNSDDSSDSGSENENEITAWAWDPEFNIAGLEIADEAYDGEEDVDLNIVENAQDDIIQRLNTSLSSGADTGLPNIVLIEDYRAQSFLESYPDAFYAVDDYIDTNDFADYKMATTNLDGNQYGVPFDSGATGIYVRTDYLEEAGFTVEDLTDITWEEYIEIGEEVKEQVGVDFLTLDPNDLGQIRMMIQSSGSWYVEEDGAIPDLADNDALAEAFQVYKNMMDADIAKVVSDWSQFVGAFNSGEVATVPTGNWITPSIKAEDSQEGEWAVVPTPRLDMEGSINASNLGGSSWYVLNIDGKEKAAEFLANTFGSDVDMYEELVTEIGAIGAYLPAMDGEAFAAEDDFFSGQSIVEDFSNWTDQIPGVTYGLHTYAIEDIIIESMQNYLSGGELSEVLNDAQVQAETQLN
ncbi:extracellular solute-binding protein [Virgibacillus sp. NKC19-3]|uniref:ABC transporter substrate-binding protein n=1 Tax=Virgibacillus saliphilus TaxID=2831674 RepID=UPI001C9A42FE|nr:extracellular solute-binding protein [Virgibacillus sp. NKC19-3]MBY7142885.1 extracellular solute-binding protein [Virgibacillus sp. NKC19-3]